MAELFHHTDEDGDWLRMVETAESSSGHVTLNIGEKKGWRSAVYLDRDAALRLAGVLLEHFNPKDGTE